MIELGKKAKDKVTGFAGVITARAQYLTGCDQYCIAPKAGKQGECPSSQWFDEGRVLVMGDGIKPSKVQGSKRGGPNRDAPR